MGISATELYRLADSYLEDGEAPADDHEAAAREARTAELFPEEHAAERAAAKLALAELAAIVAAQRCGDGRY